MAPPPETLTACCHPPTRGTGHGTGHASVRASPGSLAPVPQPTGSSVVLLRLCEPERAAQLYKRRLAGAGPRDVEENAPPPRRWSQRRGSGRVGPRGCPGLRPGLRGGGGRSVPGSSHALTLDVENRNLKGGRPVGSLAGRECWVAIGWGSDPTPVSISEPCGPAPRDPERLGGHPRHGGAPSSLSRAPGTGAAEWLGPAEPGTGLDQSRCRTGRNPGRRSG